MKKKQIKGFPGYKISTNGDVYSEIIFGRWQTRLRKITPVFNSDGYLSVRLQKNKKRKKKTIHRLMGVAFLKRRKSDTMVRHLNDVKTDNRLENLSWGNAHDNMRDMVMNGRSLKGKKISRSHHGESNPNSKLNRFQVAEIRKNNAGKTYAEIGRKYSVSHVTISRIIRGEIWKKNI